MRHLKIFISWSGNKSREVAKALREWIPMVIQVVEPYVSSEDIYKGERWSHDVSDELEKSYFGIVCVTKENINAPWIQFEAGALSKTIESSRVCPFLFDVKISEVSDPFKQFQATTFKKEDIKKLITSINQVCTTGSLEENRLDTVFEAFWPRLESNLNAIIELYSSNEEVLPTAEHIDISGILEEILDLTRQQHRILNDKQQEPIQPTKGLYISVEDYQNLKSQLNKIVVIHNEKQKAKVSIEPKAITMHLKAVHEHVTGMADKKNKLQ